MEESVGGVLMSAEGSISGERDEGEDEGSGDEMESDGSDEGDEEGSNEKISYSNGVSSTLG